MKKNIIIGLDGVPYKFIKKYIENNTLINLKRIEKQGKLLKMESSIPPISSIAWSSIITGENPGNHSIFGFTDLIENTYTIKFNNFYSLKSIPFWEKNFNETHIIYNVPQTYPARQMSGIHISGFVALDLKKAVYPSTLFKKLEENNYKIDVDTSYFKKSKDLFLREIKNVVLKRIEIGKYLWNNYDWNTFMMVFTSTDRIFHFLWDEVIKGSGVTYDKVVEIFLLIDDFIGWILRKGKEEINFLILSDHGFDLIDTEVNINTILKHENILKISLDGKRKLSLESIDKNSIAFALDPGRIYLHYKGIYKKGSVLYEEREKYIQEIEKIFLELRYNNRKVINRICRKEEIYKGKYIDKAPDMVLLPAEGFSLKAGLYAKNKFQNAGLPGDHNMNAFLLLNNNGKKIAEEINVEKVLDFI